MIADWKKAYEDMCGHEGGYANNPLDRGGETYKGIARKVWGNWKGWLILDNYKKKGYTTPEAINTVMAADERVEPLIESFYKTNFWDKVHGDELPSKLARKVFDTSVNMHHVWGIKLLQKALNGINIERAREGKSSLFVKLDEDGKYGKKTASAIQSVFNEYGKNQGQEKIINWYCDYQAERYKAIVTRNPSQVVFLKGWLRRASYRGD